MIQNLKVSIILKGGEEKNDLCTGDGGSPLVCAISLHPKHFIQVGVASGGLGCGFKDIPGLFADVSVYRDWIDSKLGEHGVDTDDFDFFSPKVKTTKDSCNKKPEVNLNCGTVAFSGGFMVNGTETKRGEWPFLVALHHLESERFFCGGSLISSQHVLTGISLNSIPFCNV